MRSYKELRIELMAVRKEIREINLSTQEGIEKFYQKRKEQDDLTKNIKRYANTIPNI